MKVVFAALVSASVVGSLACGSDSVSTLNPATKASDAQADAPEGGVQRRAQEAGIAPQVAPISCEVEASDAALIFRSTAFYTSVHEVRSSPDGHAVVLLEERTAPEAAEQSLVRLVHTPEGRTNVDLSSLLPTREPALAISEIQEGKLLVVQSATGRATISQIDLTRRALVWSRPLEDRSGTPRPHFDATGQTLRSYDWPDLKLVPSLYADTRIAQLDDGGYAVLAFLDESGHGSVISGNGVWLFGFDANGGARFRVNVVPAVKDAFKPLASLELRVGRAGESYVMARLHGLERAAFERVHGAPLDVPAFDGLPILMRVDRDGAVLSVDTPALHACAQPVRATPWALDVLGDRVGWSGECEGKSWLAVTNLSERRTHTQLVRLTDGLQQVSSVLLAEDGAVYLGGRKEFELVGTGSTVRAGAAVLARADLDGNVQALCTFDSHGDDFYNVVRSARPMLVLNYDHPLTHSEGGALAGRALVRFFTPPPAL